MARKRIVKTYKDTRARGQTKAIEGHRYFIKIDLVSVKMEESADLLSRTTEVYFKCDKGITKKEVRAPSQGTINIERNEVFKPTGGLTLYSEFKKKKDGGTVTVTFQAWDKDPSRDENIMSEKISINLGQSTEYLLFDKGGMRVKIGVSANKTRF